ncbi:MAG TPA: D-aminoacyl-tRNA deacylase [Bdellovibrionales bacterium]|nr:D-aminoacyl-tRNA deacylase [Bdellovibrionales bacterium]
MKAVLQRVSEAKVEVQGEIVGQIGPGLLILLCIEKGDPEERVVRWARRIPDLRVFSDEAGKMNVSLLETKNSVLVVSQFTLAANLTDKGRRPSFANAEAPDLARAAVDRFVTELKNLGVNVAEGRFGASMRVHLVNDGPVTFIIDEN